MSNGQVKKCFVILRDVGHIPEKKGPWLTHEHAEAFLREAIACRPATTEITYVQLTWDGDLWVEDGREYVKIADAMASIPPEAFAEFMEDGE
jgi:hypothetical protein